MNRMRLTTLPIILIVLASPALAQHSLIGTARSIDGDSLYVGAKEVRLFGIDAP
jgi:endonuclease YncB( thermonuclease family)